MRAVFGRPGSVQRYLAGAGVIVFVGAMLFTSIGYLGRIVVFIVVSVIVLWAIPVRTLATGEEDEFRSAVRRVVHDASHAEKADSVHGEGPPDHRDQDSRG